MPIVFFLHRRFLFLLCGKLSKLAGKKILNAELVFVCKVRNVHRGAARADPVGTDRAGVPGSKPGHAVLLFTI